MIVFWLEYPLMHIAPLIKELASRSKVLVIFEQSIPSWRSKMGFITPDFGAANLCYSPSLAVRNRIIAANCQKQSVHIFHGLYHLPQNYTSFIHLSKTEATLGLHLEARAINLSIKSLVRRLIYCFMAKKWGRKTNFILTHGEVGVSYYAKAGFKPSKIYEFAYFSENRPTKNHYKHYINNAKQTKITKILFVGQLTSNKNLILLLQVLLSNEFESWQLNIIGDGPEKSNLKKYCKSHNLIHKVNFLGNISHDRVYDFYLSSDFLVLPSKHDGWGAVVSEAFDVGLPSIVSDKCGAAVINKYCKGGSVFRSGDFHSLKKAILKQFALIKQEPSRIACVTDHLQSHPFSAKSGALYLEAIINQVQYSGSKPLPPWKT